VPRLVLAPLALLLVLLAPAPAAQPADTTLALPYVRQVGQRFAVDVERVQEEYVAEGETERVASRVRRAWTAEVEVRGRRPAGWALAWTYRPADAPGPARRPARLDRPTSTLEHVRIVFAADSAGRPQFVLNPLWVRSHLRQALEALEGRVPASEQARLDGLALQATTADGLRALFLADAERLTLLHGRRLTLGRRTSAARPIPNPFGAGSIPATETVRLDSLDLDLRRAYLTWSLTPDPQALSAVVLELLEGFAPGAVQGTPAELARRFRVSERGEFEVDLDAGWVLRAAFERRVQAGTRTRVERTHFVTRPPARN
jgi:hypothetical protein